MTLSLNTREEGLATDVVRSGDNSMVSSVLKIALSALGILGIVLAISGGVLYSMIPNLIKKKIDEQLVLAEGTTMFENWKNIPVPIYVRIYIFNVTNPADVTFNGAKPVLEEVGPYTFKETRVKEIIGWNKEEDTVLYHEVKSYVFEKGLSAGTQDEIVYVINVPLLGIVKVALEKVSALIRPFFLPVLNSLFKKYKEELFVKRLVRELLFDGYGVPLMKDLALLAKPFIKIPQLLPNNTFGLFYGKNNSRGGTLSVFTGVRDSSKFTLMNTWENK
ncbi:scavenger receptor class B member 1-like, partial [Limulus polyphemus]|uniref:Scavenger receptor class B member 1 n=1 Tax=Limulus polyphemus TaxID=6850 RepID=A0ABM1BWN0_LIMPO